MSRTSHTSSVYGYEVTDPSTSYGHGKSSSGRDTVKFPGSHVTFSVHTHTFHTHVARVLVAGEDTCDGVDNMSDVPFDHTKETEVCMCFLSMKTGKSKTEGIRICNGLCNTGGTIFS